MGFVSSSLWTLEEFPQTHFHIHIYISIPSPSTLALFKTYRQWHVFLSSLPFPSLNSSPSDFLHSCLAFYSKVSDKPTEACLDKTPSGECESSSAPDPSGGPRAPARLPLWGPKDLFDHDGKIWNACIFGPFPWCNLRLEYITWLLPSKQILKYYAS